MRTSLGGIALAGEFLTVIFLGPFSATISHANPDSAPPAGPSRAAWRTARDWECREVRVGSKAEPPRGLASDPRTVSLCHELLFIKRTQGERGVATVRRKQIWNEITDKR